jgi:predicted dinucleotide-utilizing enzyme
MSDAKRAKHVAKKRVGIVGYGSLGKHLVTALLENPACADYELAFVWNR